VDIPLAKDVRPGTRFSVKTPNGIVEFRVVKFAHGRGADKHQTTIDGITQKQVVPQAHCSIRSRGSEFKGQFSMVHPMDDGTWAVRAEFLMADEEFWEGADSADRKPSETT
jgi:hypothetical protein